MNVLVIIEHISVSTEKSVKRNVLVVGRTIWTTLPMAELTTLGSVK
jgi:hypothetical protein